MQFAETDSVGARFVNEKDNVADLAARIVPAHQELYNKYGHTFQEAAFFNRRFVIVKCRGKNKTGGPRPPEVLGAVRVLTFGSAHDTGSKATIIDEASSHIMTVDHVPKLLFRYPVFVSIPIYQGLKWEARELQDGSYKRSLIFGMCFKQQSAVTWFNNNNVCVVTHNNFERLFEEKPTQLVLSQ